MVRIIRYLLLPFAVLYGILVRTRHFLYDSGWLVSKTFETPTICVGNLSVGGTGKTPMIEYLIRFLKNDFTIGVLSRGYKRKTKGFVLANEKTTVADVGDEPLQFWTKYPEIILAVDANRSQGITALEALPNAPEVILLDDAFQHRKVKATCNVLLTAYPDLFTYDWLLPTGNLRDVTSRAALADVIVVTKCPNVLPEEQQQTLTRKLRKRDGQPVFFAKINYAKSVLSQTEVVTLESFLQKSFVLVTGIAKAQPLVDFLKSQKGNFKHIAFPDHHNFTTEELRKLSQHSRILTTEKDYMRLKEHLPDLFYLPIEMGFLNMKQQNEFERIIRSKIRKKD